MMVTLLVWAYAQGVASSRRMESLCGQDVAFRVICGGNLPDHSTIARFRQDFADPVTVLFGQVLILCARLGMGKLGTVALDGSKVKANAAKAAPHRTEETLAKMAAERVAAHAETDAAEDALFRDARGDEVPAAAADPHTRDERIDAALASARAERERRERQRAEQDAEQAVKAAEYLAAARAGTPKAGNPPGGTAVALAEAKVAREIAAQQAKCQQWEQRAAAAGKKPGGRGRPVPPEQYCRVRAAQAKSLIATGKRRDLEKTARDTAAAQDDGQDDDVIKAMAARLATEDGITAYRQRGHIAETPHGDIKHNMRFRQLSLRGKRKAAAEWKFACAVHNLRTAISSGHLTHDAPGPQVT
jgi:hypothetical protein